MAAMSSIIMGVSAAAGVAQAERQRSSAKKAANQQAALIRQQAEDTRRQAIETSRQAALQQEQAAARAVIAGNIEDQSKAQAVEEVKVDLGTADSGVPVERKRAKFQLPDTASTSIRI
jgi:uncharacterized protein YaiL (DUF2058 family)